MANGGWIIVLVIIALAVLTGFMVSAYQSIAQEQVTNRAALSQSVQKIADANETATANAKEIENYKQEDEHQQATATANSKELDNAQETIRSQKATISALSVRGSSNGGSTSRTTIVDSARTTAVPTVVPVTGDRVSPSLSWLPVLVLGFFTIVVVGAYRMLKIEDRAQAQAQ